MVVSMPSGEVVNYPVVEMEFNAKSNQVEYIISPARIDQEIKEKAENLALRVSKSFGNIGLLAVEMFLTTDGDILVNEVAPRPHNSYHFSIEGSETSQFEQLIRSILDLPVGKTNMINNSVMVNLVGEHNRKGPVIYKNMDQIIGIEGVNPHIYEKKETRPHRKMGHITVVNSNIEKAIKIAKEIKETVKVTSN